MLSCCRFPGVHQRRAQSGAGVPGVCRWTACERWGWGQRRQCGAGVPGAPAAPQRLCPLRAAAAQADGARAAGLHSRPAVTPLLRRRSLCTRAQSGALFDSLTVGENVGFLLHEHTKLPQPRIQARRRRAGCAGLRRAGLRRAGLGCAWGAAAAALGSRGPGDPSPGRERPSSTRTLCSPGTPPSHCTPAGAGGGEPGQGGAERR